MNIERIKQAVEDKGISITKLTEEIGVNRKTWYKWMNGKTQPTYKNAVKLCKALNIDMRDLED